MTFHRSDEITNWCSDLPGATLDHAFGEQTDVHRVGKKIFALVNVDGGEIVTLKAETADAVALTAEHDFVSPGYYMNKKHWITVDLSADLVGDELRELIHESYRLVLTSLPKGTQQELQPEPDR